MRKDRKEDRRATRKEGIQLGLGSVFAGATVLVLGGLVGFAAVRYRVCDPDQVMVRTGMGINGLQVARKGMVWPFQKCRMISTLAKTYEFNLHNMSKGKVEFNLPVVFTIKPITPDGIDGDLEGFKRYAKFLEGLAEYEVQRTIGGVIEGETRGLTAKMSVEEMFSGKDLFRKTVTSAIGRDLADLGLAVVNANIKEMSDYDDKNKYFEYRKKRAIETANFEAEVDVAEAKKMGDIGVKERERDTRVQTAMYEREAKTQENDRKGEVATSNAALAEAEAEAFRRSEVAAIEANMAAKIRSEELSQVVFQKHTGQQIEEQRSKELVEAKVAAEAKIAQASGEADAMRTLADASLYAKQKEADGILAVYQAQAEGLERIYSASGQNPELAKFQMALEKDLFPTLAEHQANAVQNLNPKMNIWTTGSDGGKNPMTPFQQLLQSFGPMLDGLDGKVQLPSYMPQQPNDTVQPPVDAQAKAN